MEATAEWFSDVLTKSSCSKPAITPNNFGTFECRSLISSRNSTSLPVDWSLEDQETCAHGSLSKRPFRWSSWIGGADPPRFKDFRVPTQAQPQPMKCLTRKIPFNFCSQPRVPPKKKGWTDHCQIKLMSYLWVIWFLYPRLSDVSRFSWIARIKQSIYMCFRLSYFHFIHRAAHCARYKDLHTSIWCHLFRFFFLPATRALNSGLLSSFSSEKKSTSSWSRASDWKNVQSGRNNNKNNRTTQKMME